MKYQMALLGLLSFLESDNVARLFHIHPATVSRLMVQEQRKA